MSQHRPTRRTRSWTTSLLALGALLVVVPGLSAAAGAAPSATPAGAGPVATTSRAGTTRAANTRSSGLVRVGAIDRPPAGTVRTGLLPASTELDLELVMAPRDPARLAALAASVSDPSSPDYHRFLPRSAFRSRFGPSQATVDAIGRWLRSKGLDTTGLAPDGLALRVRATSSRIDRAFSIGLASYHLRDGSTAYAADGAPLMPVALASQVVGVLGLDDLGEPTPAGLKVSPARPDHAAAPPLRHAARSTARPSTALTPTAACQQAVTSADAGYTLDQIASYYGFDAAYAAGDSGSGVDVGLIEYAPILPSDIAAFEQCYGQSSSPSMNVVDVDGGPGPDPGTSNEIEAELDVEIVAALAPAATITLYEAPLTSSTAYDSFAAAISADSDSVLSTSFGSCEPEVTTVQIQAENMLFEQAALQGQTVVAAAGDQGSEDCYGTTSGATNTALEVDDPASQPYVTGVGGTTLTGGPNLASGSGTEVVWNSGLAVPDPGAGGGGVSKVWPMPAYQSGAPAGLDVVGPQSACSTGGGNCREVPDVSANAGAAIAVYCTFDVPKMCGSSGWTPLGGTSAATPIWASLLALVDANPACSATGVVGFANPALYAIAGGSGYAAAFHDVTSGDNDLTGTNGGQYQAGPGYNLAGGLGTPIAGSGSDNGLIAQLCSAGSHAIITAALPPPEVTKLKPASARSRGGAHVVITGEGFAGATAVRFGRRLARFTVISSTRMIAVVPPGHSVVHVVVTRDGSSSSPSSTDRFSYLTPPVITSITPSSGPASGGTVVSVHGRYLTGVRSVRFGTSTARFTVDSSSEVTAFAPKQTGASGIVTVTIATTAGTSPPSPGARFSYSAAT